VIAHLLDVEGAAGEVSAVGPRRPMLSDRDILYVAARPETPTERDILLARNLAAIPLEEVHRDPRRAAGRAAAWGSRFDRLLVHVDVDALAYTAFPIAENVRREDGLSLAELGAILGPLLAAPTWAALTIAEVNPDHAPVEADTFGAFLGMLGQAFAEGAGDGAPRAEGLVPRQRRPSLAGWRSARPPGILRV
jgi:arginase